MRLGQPLQQVCDELVLGITLRAVAKAGLAHAKSPASQRDTDALRRHCLLGQFAALNWQCHFFPSACSGSLGPVAFTRSIFKTIKAELIWRRTWETRRQAETAIFQYINGFYNPRRRHSALGGKSPLAFERQVA